ncbi:PQQ-binding-like beta-propeller repeat protein [Emticicia fontis]
MKRILFLSLLLTYHISFSQSDFPCQKDYNVVRDVFSGIENYPAAETIVASNKVYDNSKVSFKTKNAITLNPGFSVANGSTFTTSMMDKGCVPEYNQSVYISTLSYYLHHINAETGVIKWSFKANGQIVSSPTVAYGLVYVGSWDKKLYAIDTTNGQVKWSYTTENVISTTPAVKDSVVYITGSDGNLNALNAITGQKIWSRYLEEGNQGLYIEIRNGIVYHNIYNSYDGNRLFAVDIATRQIKWVASLPPYTNPGQIPPQSVATPSQTIYVGGSNNAIHAVDAITGNVKWNFIADNPIDATPLLENGIVYCSTNLGHLYALNASTGQLIWDVNTHSTSHNSASIIIAYGILFWEVSYGLIYYLDPNTGQQKDITSGSGLGVTPTVVNGTVYSGWYAIDAVSRRIKWAAQISGPMASSPCVVTSTGKIYRGFGNIHP